MALSSSSATPASSSSPVTLSLPKSCTKQIASKIENLVEYSYVPKSVQINESFLPLISPYHLYKKRSFTRSIKTLISTKRPHPKEYIQSSPQLKNMSLLRSPQNWSLHGNVKAIHIFTLEVFALSSLFMAGKAYLLRLELLYLTPGLSNINMPSLALS